METPFCASLLNHVKPIGIVHHATAPAVLEKAMGSYLLFLDNELVRTKQIFKKEHN